jgi:GNAT superfamily N-acetyltransferase
VGEAASDRQQGRLDVVVRPAVPADAPALGVIGPAAYAEAYAYLWDQAGDYAKQLNTFSAAAFADFLGGSDRRVWLAELHGTPVGFLTAVVGSPDPIRGRGGGLEIPRIYLVGPARHGGIGWRLLAEAETFARQCGCSYAWLDAMASADRAIRTYERWGFAAIGRTPFGRTVRPGLDELVVLSKDLATGAQDDQLWPAEAGER